MLYDRQFDQSGRMGRNTDKLEQHMERSKMQFQSERLAASDPGRVAVCGRRRTENADGDEVERNEQPE